MGQQSDQVMPTIRFCTLALHESLTLDIADESDFSRIPVRLGRKPLPQEGRSVFGRIDRRVDAVSKGLEGAIDWCQVGGQ